MILAILEVTLVALFSLAIIAVCTETMSHECSLSALSSFECAMTGESLDPKAPATVA